MPRFLLTISLLAIVALVFAPANAAAECTVHGSVYDWSTFDTVKNAVVEVYAMPGHSLQGNVVAKTGSYSFSLPKGDYMLVATAGTPGTPGEVIATENVTVPDSGERIMDLILFPPDSLGDLQGFTDDNATPTLPPDVSPTLQPTAQPTAMPNPEEQLSQQNWVLYLGAGAIVLAIIAIIAGLLLLRKIRPKPPAEVPPEEERPVIDEQVPPPAVPVAPPEEQKQAPQLPPPPQPSVRDLLLPEDCREVLAIMEKNGGRITQLDLRKALPYSEAKVSLIVSDLESRGLIKKIKKGRGNVLIMNRNGEPDH